MDFDDAAGIILLGTYAGEIATLIFCGVLLQERQKLFLDVLGLRPERVCLPKVRFCYQLVLFSMKLI